MIPLTFLAAVLAVTLAAAGVHVVCRRRTAGQLRSLAAELGMQYAGRDLFHITPRVIEGFPVPGASDLRVMDVIYRREPDRFRYLFTIEYTLGVVRSKCRVRRAAMLCEPRDATGPLKWSALELAPEGLGLSEQYSELCRRASPPPP